MVQYYSDYSNSSVLLFRNQSIIAFRPRLTLDWILELNWTYPLMWELERERERERKKEKRMRVKEKIQLFIMAGLNCFNCKWSHKQALFHTAECCRLRYVGASWLWQPLFLTVSAFKHHVYADGDKCQPKAVKRYFRASLNLLLESWIRALRTLRKERNSRIPVPLSLATQE